MKAHEHFLKSHEHHTSAAEHHVGLVKFHDVMAERHPEDAHLHKTASAHHQGLVEFHLARAKHYKTLHDDATKTSLPDDIEKARTQLEKTNVSRVTPNAPADGLRAVPRIGSAPLQRPEVPMEFEKTFSVEAED
jgi:hypothetical protein